MLQQTSVPPFFCFVLFFVSLRWEQGQVGAVKGELGALRSGRDVNTALEEWWCCCTRYPPAFLSARSSRCFLCSELEKVGRCELVWSLLFPLFLGTGWCSICWADEQWLCRNAITLSRSCGFMLPPELHICFKSSSSCCPSTC